MDSLRRCCRVAAGTLFLFLGHTAIAGFASTETYLPAVGRIPGLNGAQFYTTVWATNLTGVPVTFTFDFLKNGQANTSPAHFQDALSPGQTKMYENVVESKLGLTNALGAARVTSSGEILLAERIYDQAPGDDLGKTVGLFFAGVPKTFSIVSGQSASIQGVNQGGSENFRYNFALIETGGGSPTVNVQVFDGNGTMLGQKAYPMQPYEQLQPGVADVVPGFSSINARITATVTGGTGSVLLAGAQLANISQDSSGFEMSFRDDILGSGGTAGVTSLNGLTGGVTLAAGSNVTLNKAGQTITIAAAGGGGGGLTLPFTGSTSTSQTTFAVSNTGSGQAIEGDSSAGVSSSTPAFAIKGASSGMFGTGVYGTTRGTSGETGWAGVWGDSHDATAVQGTSFNDRGVLGVTSSSSAPGGVEGLNRASGGVGVLGISHNPSGQAKSSAGVWGDTDAGVGVRGTSSNSMGVYGTSSSPNGAGVFGGNAVGAGVSGQSGTSYGVSGVSLGGGVGVFGGSASSNGIIGQTSFATAAGVQGQNTNTGTAGYLGGQNYGVFSHGDIKSDGGKSFVEPHPSDPSKEINYVCLEGRESGTYFRGSGHIVGGFATIDVPEDFRMVTSGKGLTVQVTPIGEFATLVVKSYGLDRIVMQANRDVEFFYMVNGVRKALEDHRPIVENLDFVPKNADDAAFGKGLPAESVRRLKANGSLNSDGSINLETAHRLGWDQQESWKRAEVAKEK